ncbi:hypothetical protein [Microbulbifer magnicolonia]|nr:hypothetical protein [Microbulbifer sp. GG15]
MKAIIAIVNRSTAGRSGQRPRATECNYADNYYGDQVCVARPHPQ